MPIYQDGELRLYGFVGDNLWDDGFTAREVLAVLDQHGHDADLVVRINSGGGYVDDGRSIYNALKLHQGKVTVYVDAIAASSASLIAMAGDEIIMREGALMMIHDPSGMTVGTAHDHEVTRQALERTALALAQTYASRSGQTLEDVQAAMSAVTWMSAEEAVAQGYADEVEEATDRPTAFAAYDYRTYAGAPKELVALARQRGWSLKAQQKKAAASAASKHQKETLMTEKTKADAGAPATEDVRAETAKAVKARIGGILALAEAKGRDDLAQHLAFETDLSVDAAQTILAKAPGGAVAPSAPAVKPDDLSAQAAAYEQQRLAAARQAQPQNAPGRAAVASIDRRAAFATLDAASQRRG